ncbi:KpsF/GutQ family sugar-phosphate isomerase [Fodinicurvata fenggangensis]|uniref:KpsF/GutQ family sugar-phosphate isomerase n=1 Tax=Fodinicurvata fenggangensis TaxID=1121830 RepID=UPI00047D347C|nr:KpsF/GutQ family sugar-phosphate isomerase [Fodinicurvata fenggangensis]
MDAQAKRTAETAETPEQNDIRAARRALATETEGLTALSESLGMEFIEALDRLERVDGRVIVTGMGKSGHIGCKIAATLASTGTPSQFVHPAEASHGDLGMVARGDAIIALSNSGNTPELAAIVSYSRRFNIPLIAITSRRQSVLGEAADTVLLLPPVDEACPMGLAPTTSTTMALALGDAMAIALLERRGFSPEDFQVFHPGGSLGKKLVRVSDIMHGPGELPLCQPESSMKEAIITMSAMTFGCVGVVDAAGELIGIITDGDLRRHIDSNLLEQAAGDVMTGAPLTIRAGALAVEALRLMHAHKITSLFVVEEGRPIGFLRMHDLLREGVA